MTLEDGRRLRERWKKTHANNICQHRQLINNLKSNDGKLLNVWICMECGEILQNLRS